MFLISTLVPNAACPTGRTETLASQRKLPSSMLPSQISRYMRIERSMRRYAPASAMVRMSGSLTISSNGTPERLKSTRLASPCASWMFFPVSSSMWMRVRPIRLVPPSSSTSSQPPVQIGASYMLI